MPRQLLERRKLKKIRDFLNKNKKWVCLSECKKDDPQCERCTMRLLIDYACSSNKSATVNTFVNSHLWEPFQMITEIYEKYKDASRNNKLPANKKTIENYFCSILM